MSEMIREHKWSLSNHGSKKTKSVQLKFERVRTDKGDRRTEPKHTTTAKNKTTTDEQNGRQRHRTDSTPRDKLHRSARRPNNKNNSNNNAARDEKYQSAVESYTSTFEKHRRQATKSIKDSELWKLPSLFGDTLQ